jgi:hypothetical protein
MLYREIIAVCSQIHTKTHKYTVWTEELVVHIQVVTARHLRILAKVFSVIEPELGIIFFFTHDAAAPQGAKVSVSKVHDYTQAHHTR